MSDQLYRVKPDALFRTFTMAELSRALFTAGELGGSPANPALPRGEWYCTNETCAIREVEIQAKYRGEPPTAPPTMYCPACGKRLKFHGYRGSGLTLIPASAGE